LYFDNEIAVSIFIEDLTREIWHVIRKVLNGTATEQDLKGAAEKNKYLRLYIHSYESRYYSYLNDSSLWLAKEVSDAVTDLIDI
jgi:hypothetical protein